MFIMPYWGNANLLEILYTLAALIGLIRAAPNLLDVLSDLRAAQYVQSVSYERLVATFGEQDAQYMRDMLPVKLKLIHENMLIQATILGLLAGFVVMGVAAMLTPSPSAAQPHALNWTALLFELVLVIACPWLGVVSYMIAGVRRKVFKELKARYVLERGWESLKAEGEQL